MTTLKDQPKSQTRPFADARSQPGNDVAARQTEQQGRERPDSSDRQQSAQDDETFTVSSDDWFKA